MRNPLLSAALAVALAATAAQGLAAQDGDLRQTQRALLGSLKADPSNADLMMRYAEVSVQLDDHEAAIPVLKKLLSSPSHASQARLELGVAYFYLGRYDVADPYLIAVLEDPGATSAMHQRAELHLDEIAFRTGAPSQSLASAIGVDYGPAGKAPARTASRPVPVSAAPATPVETSVATAQPAPAVQPVVTAPRVVAETPRITTEPPPATAQEPRIVTTAAPATAQRAPGQNPVISADTPVPVVPVAYNTGVDPTVPSSDLQTEQRRLYTMLLSDPANIELMFDYVEASIRLKDYEAAIATLERMLIYRRDLSRVRLELGVAYFNLGSYEAAKLYFTQVLDDPEISSETRERVALYLGEIEGRTDRSSFSMVANLGVTYSTNASLGPLSDEIVVGGVPGFELDPDSQSQSDFGIRTLVYGTHAYDLQQPNTNAWVTDFSVFGLRYFDVEAGNTAYARLRTGPRLALDARQFGPKIRPYVEGQYLNGDDTTIFWNATGGAEYTRPVSDEWAAFADVSAGYFDFQEDRDAEDMASLRLVAGGAFLPSRDLSTRVMVIAERDIADADYNSNYELGARASAEYQYDSGLDIVDRKWAISGYADARYRWYDEEDDFVDPNETRGDLDLRFGLGHLFAIRKGYGIMLDVEALKRDSNITNFDLENFGVTVSAQKRL